jgi:hypothetical protein
MVLVRSEEVLKENVITYKEHGQVTRGTPGESLPFIRHKS